MNNIDKDIEQFEQNLITINVMKDQILDLKNSLNNMLGETEDINKIKEGINKEIENIHKIYDDSNNKIKELNNIAEDVRNSLGKDSDKIINETDKGVNVVEKINPEIVAKTTIKPGHRVSRQGYLWIPKSGLATRLYSSMVSTDTIVPFRRFSGATHSITKVVTLFTLLWMALPMPMMVSRGRPKSWENFGRR